MFQELKVDFISVNESIAFAFHGDPDGGVVECDFTVHAGVGHGVVGGVVAVGYRGDDAREPSFASGDAGLLVKFCELLVVGTLRELNILF